MVPERYNIDKLESEGVMAKVSMSENTIDFRVRCPVKLHKQLTTLAREQGRSMHSQVVMILEEYFDSKRGSRR